MSISIFKFPLNFLQFYYYAFQNYEDFNGKSYYEFRMHTHFITSEPRLPTRFKIISLGIKTGF